MALTLEYSYEEVQVGWPDDDDLRLAESARVDRASFGLLYDRYVDRIYGYCYRRLRTREAAEDATSQVFLKALGAIARFRPESGSFRGWLFTIAHREVIDSYRREKPAAPLDGIGELADSDSDSGPEGQALIRETSRDLYALVHLLPEEQANLVQLRLPGLTDREIASVLGRSFGAIRIAQHRAIRRLRELAAADDEMNRTPW